jgi:hypothetical protein
MLLDRTLRAQATVIKIQMGWYHTRKLWHSKGNDQPSEKTALEREKTCPMSSSNKGSVSRAYKGLIQIIQLKKLDKGLKRYFSKEDIEMAKMI